MGAKITFGRTAYVENTPSDMLDAMEREGMTVMTGDGLVCVVWDDLPQADPGDLTRTSMLEAYLWKARLDILEVDGGDRLVDHVVFME